MASSGDSKLSAEAFMTDIRFDGSSGLWAMFRDDKAERIDAAILSILHIS